MEAQLARWNKNFERLKSWAKENKAIPKTWVKTQPERSLGQWAAHQRTAKKGGKLSQEKIKKLESVSCWFWVYDVFWVEKFRKLKSWAKKNNALPSLGAKTKLEKPLALWMRSQRTAKKRGIISQERIDKLETIPGWFWDKYGLNVIR